MNLAEQKIINRIKELTSESFTKTDTFKQVILDEVRRVGETKGGAKSKQDYLAYRLQCLSDFALQAKEQIEQMDLSGKATTEFEVAIVRDFDDEKSWTRRYVPASTEEEVHEILDEKLDKDHVAFTHIMTGPHVRGELRENHVPSPRDDWNVDSLLGALSRKVPNVSVEEVKWVDAESQHVQVIFRTSNSLSEAYLNRNLGDETLGELTHYDLTETDERLPFLITINALV